MRKMKLNLDELAIESFATTKKVSARRGTVHGAANTREPYTLVIADTVVTCTVWPAGPVASVDYCAETGEPEYQTLAEGESC